MKKEPTKGITAETLHEALKERGIETEIEWSSWYMGMGKLSAGPIEIAIDNGRAFVLASCLSKCGHGSSRLPSHPLYPALITNPTIVKIEEVIKKLSS